MRAAQGAVFIVFAVAAACDRGSPGDRLSGRCASDETCSESPGGCPAGEVCSPDVTGLRFETSADWPRLPSAEHGSRWVKVRNADLVSTEYREAFLATSSDPSVLTIARTAPPEVTIATGEPGSAFVEIREAAGGALLDRLEMEVDELAQVTLCAGADDPLVFVGSMLSLPVCLVGHEGQLLVDDSVSDLAFVAGSEAGVVERTIHAGGDDWPVSVVVVDSIDQLALTRFAADGSLELGDVIELAVGEIVAVCAGARHGGAGVLGIETRWEMDEVDPTASVDSWSFPACRILRGEEPGQATFTVRAANLQREVSLQVRP